MQALKIELELQATGDTLVTIHARPDGKNGAYISIQVGAERVMLTATAVQTSTGSRVEVQRLVV